MTENTSSIQSRYSILLSPEADEKVVSAIRDIEEGYEAGSISNARYTEAKRTINYRMKAAWEKVVDVYFRARKLSDGGNAHKIAALLYYDVPSSLRDMLFFGAKLEKAAALKGTSFEPFLDTMTHYHNEMLPLAQKVDALKSMTVKKGAATSANSTFVATSANPDQVRGTCPFCFRTYAVVGETIAKHGHTVSRSHGQIGYHTSACPGSGKLPYEVSSAGVAAGVRYLETLRTNTETYLDDYKNWVTVFRENDRVNKGEAGWEDAVSRERALGEKRLEGIREKIAQLHEKMGDWEKRPLFNKSGKEVA